MTPATFFAHFDALADAPDAVAKLRELILQLAVQGKLVPQDPKEEPATLLLQRIEDERTALVEAGEIRKSESESPLNGGGQPYAVPQNWAWTTLGRILRKMGAGSTPLGGKKVYVDDGIMFLRSQNVWDSGLVLTDVARIAPEIHDDMSGTQVQPGDVLLNITGASIGRCALVPDGFAEANVSQHVAILRLIDKDLRHFLHLCVISPFFQDTIMRVQVGVSREGLAMNRLRDFSFPVPPLAEQQRIVAKVDELMRLCDELEGRGERKRAARERLSAAALDRVLAAQEPDEFATHWQRICEHFDLLYDAPETLAQLRQSILAFALDGRLTTDCPLDKGESENGDALLSSIRETRRRIWEQSEIDRLKASGRCPADDRWKQAYREPYRVDRSSLPKLPPTWQWASVDELTLNVTSGSRGWKQFYAASGSTFIRSQDIKTDVLDLSSPAYVTVPTTAEGARTKVQLDDLLVTITGANVGKAAHVDRDVSDAYVSQHVALIRPVDARLSSFMHQWLVSERRGRGMLLGRSYGDKPGLNLDNIRTLPVPIPPIAAQRRIVAKVDHLMSLCDALEAKLKQSQADSERLLAAAVHGLLNGVTAEVST